MKIVTDSAADLRQEEKRSDRIYVAPLFIQFPEGGVSAEDICPDDFYDRLRAMVPAVPTTSQPSAGDFAEIYRTLSLEETNILSIHISSGLSGTLESARVGASQVEEAKVTLVDSRTLSGGQRFQVLAALQAIRAGWPAEEILELLNRIRASTETIYTLETLDYLARGGRIGRVQALAGSLLKIKPVIKVDKADGKYSSAGKGRTLKQTLNQIVDHLSQVYDRNRPLWVSVMHGQFSDYAENLAEIIQRRLNVAKAEILRISPVLGVHTGPGVVGAAVVPMELFEGLE